MRKKSTDIETEIWVSLIQVFRVFIKVIREKKAKSIEFYDDKSITKQNTNKFTIK